MNAEISRYATTAEDNWGEFYEFAGQKKSKNTKTTFRAENVKKVERTND